LTAANSVDPSVVRDGVLLPRKVKGTLALNVWCPGNDRVFSFKTNSLCHTVMRSPGIKVYDPDLTEFVDCGGGPHCMTFELERDKG
jgi:N-dimethylarginine dimethylaminohydrolase